MTETESMWRERVRTWRASGQSAPEFSAGRGFAASTLRYYASRFARAARTTALAAPIRVRLLRVAPVASEPSPLVVSVGAARIEVRAGFDRSLLRDVVDALGEAR